MKNYVTFITLIGLILSSFIIYNILNVKQERSQEFISDGYILQASSQDNVERYYFSQSTKYENKYNEKVIFKDTTGEKITAEHNNFIHYTDGSISSFQNGVIINLNELDKEPILYYNIAKNKVLKKSGDVFLISHLNGKLEFENFIWKIQNNKYLIYSDNMKVTFSDGTVQNIQGYLEIEYTDNEVIQLYNQEVTYKTISSNLKIDISPDITINLDNKIVSKSGENKMSLLNMIIDSDENVEIVDLEDYEVKENETGNITGEDNNSSETNNNGGNNNSGINGNSGSIINNNNSNSGSTIITDNTTSVEEIIENSPTIEAPSFKVEEFEVDSISVKAKISIEDEKQLLSGDTTIQIIKNSTGKTVYEDVQPFGIYNIDLQVMTLEPNTQYTLKVSSAYKVEEINYTRNFIYKIFRTDITGITLEKDLITENSIKLKILTDSYSKVNSLKIALYSQEGNIVATEQTINTVTNKENYVEFSGLTANTTYVAKIYDIQYDNKVVLSNINMTKEYTTLKTKPTIAGTEFLIDKVTGKFTLKLNQIEDPNGGIVSYAYNIYQVDGNETEHLVKQITNTNYSEIDVLVDGVDITRNTPYIFKVIGLFNDNEKLIEYESEYSNIMKIDGVTFPTVSFVADSNENAITFERIRGSLIIEDTEKAIYISQEKPFIIYYTDSVGNQESFTCVTERINGKWTIPVDVNNLRKNETYQFAIYAGIDLQDGNDPIDQHYIGGAIVKTTNTKELTANFDIDEKQIEDSFNIKFQLSSTNYGARSLEAETLSTITFSIYAGQSTEGEPIATIVDKGVGGETYNSELKKEYYDNSIEITPKFFGLSNLAMTESSYTIKVSKACDYTKWQNEFVILDDVVLIKTNNIIPDPVENPITVTPITNREAGENKRDDLLNSTIVAYNVRTNGFDNSRSIAKKIVFSVYDVDTDKQIATQEIEIGETEDVNTKSVTFYLQDGTRTNIEDTELRRGNKYYFSYYIECDINNDGEADSIFPNDGEIIRSIDYYAKKQEPTIVLYEKTSDESTITYKYKCTDIDSALTDNTLYIRQANGLEGSDTIYIGEEDYLYAKFTGLTEGNYTIYINKKLIKSEEEEEDILLTKYFEGINNVNNVTYSTSIVDNALVRIKFSNIEDVEDSIAGVKIEFKPTDGTQSITKDYMPIYKNDKLGSYIDVNLYDIIRLKGKEVQILVEAYYDNGQMGFETAIDSQTGAEKIAECIALEKYGGDKKQYYAMQDNGTLVEQYTIQGNIYNVTKIEETNDERIMEIKNTVNKNLSSKITLRYSSQGFTYSGGNITVKTIAKAKINSIDNTILFENVIPGIDIYDKNGNKNIKAQIKTATVTAKLYGTETITDGKIFIELSQTESGVVQSTKTLEYNVSDFANPVVIENLIASQTYEITFSANIRLSNGSTKKVKLLDMKNNKIGQKYVFTTIGNIDIPNATVEYTVGEEGASESEKTYDNKKLKISYELSTIEGVSRIQYRLYRQEGKEEVELASDIITEDTIIMRNMKKYIDITHVEGIIFDAKYKLQIKAFFDYEEEGEQKTLTLVTRDVPFEIKRIDPIAVITGSKEITDNNEYNITFKIINVIDESHLIKNDEITISIKDDLGNNVTPDEYLGPIKNNFVNKQITLNNMDIERTYTLTVSMKIDPKNTGLEDDLITITKSYSLSPLGKNGISVGDIYTEYNYNNKNNVVLLFYNSYKLTGIDKIKYSIVNSTTGAYAYSNELNFVPTQTVVGNDQVYQFSLRLNESLEPGLYDIQINFMKDNTLIEQRSLSFTYTE